jgi:ubiquitin carboxyl-terminal hydrolase 47
MILACVSIFHFRDSREEAKQLSSEERKEIANREGSRVTRLGTTVSTYSPRKERALKIYLDTSPRRNDDVEVD